jgi:spore coat polysaccharide biosynthesis protein SpsF
VTRTRVVVQSRLNSSRLPGKALVTVAGMPLVELVARRASRGGHEVVVATSEERYDALIAAHLASVGVPVVRGALDDVLGRFAAATADLDPDDLVVRLTGDNPLVDADLVDEVVEGTLASPYRYGRVDIDRVAEGLGVEVFDVGSLRAAAAEAASAYDREHVTPWLRRTLGEHLHVPEGAPRDLVAGRCTVDCLADLERVTRLFAGVADPVAAPWRALVAGLDGAGPTVARVGTTLPRSELLVDARAWAPSGVAPAAAREILAVAVERGVTHGVVDAADGSAAAFRAALEPALARRLGVLATLRLPGVVAAGGPGAGLAVEAAVERLFADLGRRHVDALLVSGPDGADWRSGRAGRRLEEYRDAGAVTALGEEVAAGAGAGAAGPTVTLVLRPGPGPDDPPVVCEAEDPTGAPPAACSVVAPCRTPEEVLQAVRAAGGQRAMSSK